MDKTSILFYGWSNHANFAMKFKSVFILSIIKIFKLCLVSVKVNMPI